MEEAKPPDFLTVLCVFCNAPWTAEMQLMELWSSAGCDTCGYGARVHGVVLIECENCNRIVYRKEFDEEA